MKLQKVIRKRNRQTRDGVSVASDVNIAVAGNFGERGAKTQVSSRQKSTADESDTKKNTT